MRENNNNGTVNNNNDDDDDDDDGDGDDDGDNITPSHVCRNTASECPNKLQTHRSPKHTAVPIRTFFVQPA